MSLAPSYDAIYLSPHPDDGALSCGGQIFRRVARQERVLLVTVFAGDAPAEPLGECARKILFHMGLPAGEAMALRRREDRQACRELGADFDHWPLPECIFRRSPSTGRVLYPSRRDIFREPAAEDERILAELESRLRALPPAPSVFAPLAVGGHVDHRLTRRAAERVLSTAVGCYEDFPYVRRFRALGTALGGKAGWRPEVVALEPQDLAAKVRALAAYPSQLAGLFGGAERMARTVRRYARKVGGERLWYRREQVGSQA